MSQNLFTLKKPAVIFTTFYDGKKNSKFNELPKSLLETFRIIDLKTPDYINIIIVFLTILNFDGEKNKTAKKILFFFQILTNSMNNKLFLLQNYEVTKQDFNEPTEFLSFSLSFRHILDILKRLENKKIAQIQEEDIAAEFFEYFQGLVAQKKMIYIKNLLNITFPSSINMEYYYFKYDFSNLQLIINFIIIDVFEK